MSLVLSDKRLHIMDLYGKWVLSQLEKYEIISFDIYDTLIHRTTGSPSKVFKEIQGRINREIKSNEDFIFNREQAVKKAWEKTKREEITLDEIYQNYKKSNVDVNLLKQFEIEMELDCVYPDKRLKTVYEELKKNGKKIIIISDMYLPQPVIKKILEKCGYKKYEKVYVSSEIMLKKRTGNLFKFVKSDMQGKEFIHIGDNRTSDYKKAREYGIKSIWYVPSAIRRKLSHSL